MNPPQSTTDTKSGSNTSMPITSESYESKDDSAQSAKPDFRSPRNKRLGRENLEEKARRLLAEGRLNVVRVNREADVYEATVRGDSAESYDVKWDRDSARWFCPCLARGICSHVRALQLILVRDAKSGVRS